MGLGLGLGPFCLRIKAAIYNGIESDHHSQHKTENSQEIRDNGKGPSN